MGLADVLGGTVVPVFRLQFVLAPGKRNGDFSASPLPKIGYNKILSRGPWRISGTVWQSRVVLLQIRVIHGLCRGTEAVTIATWGLTIVSLFASTHASLSQSGPQRYADTAEINRRCRQSR